MIDDSWKERVFIYPSSFSSITGIFDKATMSDGTSKVILNVAYNSYYIQKK